MHVHSRMQQPFTAGDWPQSCVVGTAWKPRQPSGTLASSDGVAQPASGVLGKSSHDTATRLSRPVHEGAASVVDASGVSEVVEHPATSVSASTT